MTRSAHTMVWRGSRSWTVNRRFVGSRILLIGPGIYRFEVRTPTLTSDWIRVYPSMSNSPTIPIVSSGSRNRRASHGCGLLSKFECLRSESVSDAEPLLQLLQRHSFSFRIDGRDQNKVNQHHGREEEERRCTRFL